MVDKLNPTNQFHPYQPADATPVSERPVSSGLSAITDRLKGMDMAAMTDKLKGVDVKSQLNKARGVARSNPGLALGGLAVAAIGLGLMRKRSMS